VRSAQHLQPYHGYSIMRYFENLAPGRNGGGWVDPYGSRGYGRYFRDEAVDVGVVVAGGAWLADIASGESVAMTIRPPRGRVPAQPGPAAAGAAATSVRLPAHGWRAFRIVK
jgi:hypothetical protein